MVGRLISQSSVLMITEITFFKWSVAIGFLTNVWAVGRLVPCVVGIVDSRSFWFENARTSKIFQNPGKSIENYTRNRAHSQIDNNNWKKHERLSNESNVICLFQDRAVLRENITRAIKVHLNKDEF